MFKSYNNFFVTKKLLSECPKKPKYSSDPRELYAFIVNLLGANGENCDSIKFETLRDAVITLLLLGGIPRGCEVRALTWDHVEFHDENRTLVKYINTKGGSYQRPVWYTDCLTAVSLCVLKMRTMNGINLWNDAHRDPKYPNSLSVWYSSLTTTRKSISSGL